MTTFEENYIRSWNATWYVSTLHKWVSGLLSVSPRSLLFKSNNLEHKDSGGNPLVLFIDFSEITSINKALSSYLFQAIKIILASGETHWFSSMLERNATFLMVRHCYQASLFNKVSSPSSNFGTSRSLSSQPRTEFGTELLRTVYDSQTTLQNAAGSLVQQGNQLKNSALTVEEIHEDLSVAERITSGINSWFGRWKLPPITKTEELILVKENDIPHVWDVDALCTKIIGYKHGIQTEMVFRIGVDGISIVDMKQKIIQHFKWPEVSQIRVVSPWEILITRFFIGQPDLSYSIVSMAMPKMLKLLARFAKSKMEYMNPPNVSHSQQYEPVWDKPSSKSDSKSVTLSGKDPLVNNATEILLEAHQSTEQAKVSDAEIAELTNTLADLKSLAIDIQKEQDDQIQTIDRVTDSVTKADDRVRALNKTINILNK
ncbi:unnamed protein product [Lymnaea stagnalis]|uniref:Synaptosomal-associated protein 47 n=1 Tax=Lymnaea stagnalis TaxID=6523 RepID=A0AAV2HSK5_LYMST